MASKEFHIDIELADGRSFSGSVLAESVYDAYETACRAIGEDPTSGTIVTSDVRQVKCSNNN